LFLWLCFDVVFQNWLHCVRITRNTAPNKASCLPPLNSCALSHATCALQLPHFSCTVQTGPSQRRYWAERGKNT
ncbi:hypothetical protein, partial [Escherichia coli]|uniref:hypothetical protein n=1 Tax=Escherichia coli TaxID=562 RepID=UPI001CD9A0C9